MEKNKSREQSTRSDVVRQLKAVRSAMEPETMVAAVAQKTVWNTMYTHSGMSRPR